MTTLNILDNSLAFSINISTLLHPKDTPAGHSKQANPSSDGNTDPKSNNKNSNKPLCKVYAKGHCRHKEGCRFDHPKICFKFRSFGLKSINEKGCENQKCSFLHPNACRDSLKTKTCPREECRFFHHKGTKTVKKPAPKQHTNGNQYNHSNYIETHNRFESLSEQNSTQHKKQLLIDKSVHT